MEKEDSAQKDEGMGAKMIEAAGSIRGNTVYIYIYIFIYLFIYDCYGKSQNDSNCWIIYTITQLLSPYSCTIIVTTDWFRFCVGTSTHKVCIWKGCIGQHVKIISYSDARVVTHKCMSLLNVYN